MKRDWKKTITVSMRVLTIAVAIALIATGGAAPAAERHPAVAAESSAHRAPALVASPLDSLDTARRRQALAASAASPPPQGCTCYCGGQNWAPGSTACMSGYKHACVERGKGRTTCEWEPVRTRSGAVACDGGENCK